MPALRQPLAAGAVVMLDRMPVEGKRAQWGPDTGDAPFRLAAVLALGARDAWARPER